MTTMQKKETKQEQQYCFSRIRPRPKRTYWKPFEPSMIKPDRNMDISVIMSKYSGGQYRGLEPQYTDPDMMDMIQGIDIRKLSICELHQRMDENRANIRRMQANLQKQEDFKKLKEAEAAQKKYRDDLKAELKKEMQEIPEKH